MYNRELTEWAALAKAVVDAGTMPRYHAVLADAPYNLGFMSKDWDTLGTSAGFQAQVKLWGDAILPLLYPGAVVMMFGGTRMWHRLAAGMEDAGFAVWDTMCYIYGTGFPKGQDISKLIDKSNGDAREVTGTAVSGKTAGMQTLGPSGIKGGEYDVTAPGSATSMPWSSHKTLALKPAWEPVLCFVAPRQGNKYVECALEYGSGALNIDGGRIGTEVCGWGGSGASGDVFNEGSSGLTKGGDARPTVGRYPANLILDEVTAPLLDEQSGESKSTIVKSMHQKAIPVQLSKGAEKERVRENVGHNDSGGASRFFYAAKSSTAERNAGLSEKNTHPTLKPIDLTRYLATLLLPPSSVKRRRLLVPFSGSGSEMIGGILAGWDEVVGVEQSAEYCAIAEQRLRFWSDNATHGANTSEILKQAKKNGALNNVTPIQVATPIEVNQCNS